MRRIQRQMREEEARVLLGDQNGDPNNNYLGLTTTSEDSEADFVAFEPKALPRLGAALTSTGGAFMSAGERGCGLSKAWVVFAGCGGDYIRGRAGAGFSQRASGQFGPIIAQLRLTTD